jgi:hypothetical protein
LDSFTEGLYRFFTRGALIKKQRLNNSIKHVIEIMLKDTSEKTCDMEEYQFELFMQANIWLKHQIGLSKETIKLNVKMAGFIHFWINDYEYYPFDDKDYEATRIWIMNKLNKHYSQSEMSMSVKDSDRCV